MASLSSEAAKLVGLGILGRVKGLISLDSGELCGLVSKYSLFPLRRLLVERVPGSDKLLTSSLRLLRISSSLELVASFKLRRSVALSLLRLLSWAISL